MICGYVEMSGLNVLQFNKNRIDLRLPSLGYIRQYYSLKYTDLVAAPKIAHSFTKFLLIFQMESCSVHLWNSLGTIKRQLGVIGIGGTRSKNECSVRWMEKAGVCVGFNFKRGLAPMCELCHVPHDAPNTDMEVDPVWDHYAIIPWIKAEASFSGRDE